MHSKFLTGLAAFIASVSAIPLDVKDVTDTVGLGDNISQNKNKNGGGDGKEPVCRKDGKLNLYWGQTGVGESTRLAHYCKEYYPDYITLSFMHLAPEHAGESGWPATNFGGHCSAEVFKNGETESLLGNCDQIAEDANKCQSYGVKVLLSIGGDPSYSNVELSSEEAGEEWAEFLYAAYGPYPGDSSKIPRPFDSGDHSFVIDGFDFDIEAKYDPKPFVAMANKLRELFGSHLILTAAPQCPLNPDFFILSGILEEVSFDALFIQFYNNPSCDAIPGSDVGETFNYLAWEDYVSQNSVQKNTKLYIGLPGDGSTGGYLEPEALKETLCYVMSDKGSKHFGGVSVWDAFIAESNVDKKGANYIETIKTILDCGCGGKEPENPEPENPEPENPEPENPPHSYSSTTSHHEGHQTTYPSSHHDYPTSSSTYSHNPHHTGGPGPHPGDDDCKFGDDCYGDEDGHDGHDGHDGGHNGHGHDGHEDYPTSTYGHGGHGGHGDHDGHEYPYPTLTSTKHGHGDGYPKPTKKPSYTYTSTIKVTKTYTITSCPPEYGGCYPGAVTTEVTEYTTTICDSEPTKDATYLPKSGDYSSPKPVYPSYDDKKDAEKPASPIYPSYDTKENDAAYPPAVVESSYPTMQTSYYPIVAATAAAAPEKSSYGNDAVPAATSKPLPVTAGAGSVATSIFVIIAAAIFVL